MAIDKIDSSALDTNIDVSGSVTADSLNLNAGFGSDAAVYGVRAWVNFDGTGTVAIRDSANVSSITDVDTGKYTVNFTTAMPDTNYSVAADTLTESDASQFRAGANTRLVGSCNILIGAGVGGSPPYYVDKSYVSAIFVR